ncbi:MAG: FAD-dependent oxidoreductase [Oligoflexus sp.]
MAQVKYGVIKNHTQFTDDSFLLEIQLENAEVSKARGGQYLIINTGLELQPDKPLKRAYSILSRNEEEGTIQIAVKALTQGFASRHLSRLPLGHQLAFSGPWGKLNLREFSGDKIHIVASYTGITAALGLIADLRNDTQAKNIALHWLRPHAQYFLSDTMVRELLSLHTSHQLSIYDCPAADDPERLSFATTLFRSWSIAKEAECFACGDGLINLEFQKYLQQLWPEKNCQLENFFHKP